MYILRKHSSDPFGKYFSKGRGYTANYTVAAVHDNRADCVLDRDIHPVGKKFFYTVAKLRPTENWLNGNELNLIIGE